MKLAISNIAWTKKENQKILNMLKKNKIKHIEFAPTILKKNHINLNFKSIKKFYNNNFFELYSMQSILFNKTNHYMYGSKIHKKNLYNEVIKKIKLAKKLGSKIIIFGSPAIKKNIENKNSKQLWDESINFFKKLKKNLEKYKITICVEGNPNIYGADYINDTETAIKIVKKIKSRYLKVNLDFGTIIYNNENFKKIIEKNSDHIGHAQISLPKLKNIYPQIPQILKKVKYLKKKGYNKVISIEQLRTKKNNINKIESIIKIISKNI